jgi:hypothetical protein
MCHWRYSSETEWYQKWNQQMTTCSTLKKPNCDAQAYYNYGSMHLVRRQRPESSTQHQNARSELVDCWTHEWKHDVKEFPTHMLFTWCFLWTHFFSHAEKVTILVRQIQISYLWGSFAALSLRILRILLTKRIQKAWRPAKYRYSYLQKLWDIHKTDGKAYIIN